jgi:hypothetical protein
MGLSAARGALEPVWPSKLDDSRAALILGPVLVLERGLAEAILESHRIASHRIFLPRPNMFMVCAIPNRAEEGA